MREEVLNEEYGQGMEDLLNRSQPMFDQTLEIGGNPSSNSTDTDEDNRPLNRMVQKIWFQHPKKGRRKWLKILLECDPPPD